MARTVNDSRLHNRTQRAGLEPRGKPYYLTLHEGLHLGYRKNKTGGRWVVRWYAGDKYVTETLGTADDTTDADGIAVFDFKQAQHLAREQSTKLAATKKGVRIGPYTVADALADYFKSRDSSADNLRYEQRRSDLYITPLIGDKHVDDLTRDDVKQWRDDVAAMPPMNKNGKPRQPKPGVTEEEQADRDRARKDSANRIFTILKAALNYAFDEGKASSDHAWRRVSKFETTTKARPRYFSMNEITRLINAAEGDFRDLIRGALMTGARYGDLMAMDVGDFIGEKSLVMSGNSKGGRSHPVYLTDEGTAFFERLTAGRGAREPMFTYTGRRWAKSEQTRPMNHAMKAARIEPPASFYTLRHSYASHALMAGTPMIVVSGNIGHTDTRMVEKHYGHLADEYRSNAIKAGVPSWGGADDRKVRAI